MNNPTVSVSYHEPGSSGDPFYTEARQRIDGTRYFTIRKYYGGLGTLLETQVLGAELSSGSQDVVVSSWQGYALEGGQVRAVQAQSVPYAIPAGYGFRGWDYVIDNSYAFSQTVLDELGRPVTVTAPDGTSTSYAYDDGYSNYLPFLRLTVTDAEDHARINYTDIWGRTVLVDAPDGPNVSYFYNVSDRLIRVEYGTAATVLQYDLAGRKLSMDDPDMGDWTYTYDALGNLQTQTDARGCTTTLSYDLINRLENKSYSGSCGATTATVSYIYDQGMNGIGQRVRMDDGTGYTTWSYDARGRVIETYQSVTSGNFRTQWSYNSADLPVWMKYPANNAGNPGETVNYTYNTQMLLDRVYGTSTYVDDTWYDAAGRVTLRELGANYTLGQTYTYFPWTQQGGRLQNLEGGIAADTDSLQDLSYSYNAVGNVLSIIDYKAGGTQTQTFGYDNLDRLTSAVASGGTGGTYSLKNYAYNPDTGNLSNNAGVSYTYGDSAHKHAVTSTSNGNSYGYDQNGNQTTRTVGGITYTLIYDAESRLVQIKRGTDIQAKYFYDGDGNRIRTEVGSTITTYIGSHLEWECIDSTCAMKSYYYAAGQRVALRKGDGTLYFLLTDHLGSTAITATSSGGRDAELRYYPWGGTRYTYGTTPTSYRYTGQREAEVGLYYYGARYYDPYLNRWLQPDSIIPQNQGTQAWDRYAYSNNNPVNYTDPTGHCISITNCLDDSSYVENDKQIIVNFKKEHEENGSTVFWGGLSEIEQQIFEEAGWWEGAFNDAMTPQTSPADALHDPLTYIEIFVVGRGIIKIAIPWFIQSASSTPPNQTPNLSAIAEDIEDWVGQGEKPIAFLNQAGDFIMRNVENTRRFQFHYNNYFPHDGPHFHLDYLTELGEWIKFSFFPP